MPEGNRPSDRRNNTDAPDRSVSTVTLLERARAGTADPAEDGTETEE